MRNSQGDKQVSARDLEDLLEKTSSPNTLLRPQFWRMRPDRFCRALHRQFLSSGSADEVFPNILLGNKAAAENIELLTELGVTHLLNCAGGSRRGNVLTGSGKVKPDVERLARRGLQYRELELKASASPVQDSPGQNILGVLDDTSHWIQTVLRDNGKLLVNCFVGSSRSATVTVAFLIKYRNLSLEESLVTLKKKRDIKPNPGFLNQLIEYERLVKQTTSDE